MSCCGATDTLSSSTLSTQFFVARQNPAASLAGTRRGTFWRCLQSGEAASSRCCSPISIRQDANTKNTGGCTLQQITGESMTPARFRTFNKWMACALHRHGCGQRWLRGRSPAAAAVLRRAGVSPVPRGGAHRRPRAQRRRLRDALAWWKPLENPGVCPTLAQGRSAADVRGVGSGYINYKQRTMGNNPPRPDPTDRPTLTPKGG